MNVKNIGEYVGILSLVIAILAFLPAIAAFTPAIIGSVIAFLGAIVGALSGRERTAILTFYSVIATFLVSPVCRWIEQYIALEKLVLCLMILGLILALGLHINYRKSWHNT